MLQLRKIPSEPTLFKRLHQLLMVKSKTLCDALQLLQESGEIINKEFQVLLSHCLLLVVNELMSFMEIIWHQLLTVAGEEVVVGEVVGFGGFPLIGPHIQSWNLAKIQADHFPS